MVISRRCIPIKLPLNQFRKSTPLRRIVGCQNLVSCLWVLVGTMDRRSWPVSSQTSSNLNGRRDRGTRKLTFSDRSLSLRRCRQDLDSIKRKTDWWMSRCLLRNFFLWLIRLTLRSQVGIYRSRICTRHVSEPESWSQISSGSCETSWKKSNHSRRLWAAISSRQIKLIVRTMWWTEQIRKLLQNSAKISAPWSKKSTKLWCFGPQILNNFCYQK